MKASSKVIVALLVLVVLVQISCCSRRKHSRRKITSKNNSNEKGNMDGRNKTNYSTEKVAVKNKQNSRSREYRSKRGRKNENILKTSMRAKIVTERRYLKKDWCKSQPVRQKVSTRNNCHGVLINQFCYGQCNSFYIPKDIIVDLNQDLDADYFKSCSFCKPKREEEVSVRMRCRNIRKTRMPRFITKRIKRVKGCTCIAVPDLNLSEPKENPKSRPPEEQTTTTSTTSR